MTTYIENRLMAADAGEDLMPEMPFLLTLIEIEKEGVLATSKALGARERAAAADGVTLFDTDAEWDAVEAHGEHIINLECQLDVIAEQAAREDLVSAAKALLVAFGDVEFTDGDPCLDALFGLEDAYVALSGDTDPYGDAE